MFLELDPWDPDEVGAISVSSYFRLFEDVAGTLSQQKRIRLLRAKMRGTAKQFMIDNMGSYEGENPYLYMKQAMIQWYERDNPGKAAASLCTLKRQPTETLRQFAEKIRQLAQIAVQEEGAELNAAQKIQWVRRKVLKAFIRGVGKEVGSHLLSTEPTTIEAALKRAEELEETLGERDEVEVRWDLSAVQQGDRKCYACGAFGHFAARCASRGTNVSRDVGHITIIEKPMSRTLRMNATLNNESRSLILDTGAAVSVLTVPVRGTPILPTNATAWGADGYPLKFRGEQQVQVNLGGVEFDHTFLVFEQEGTGLDLLGMDILKKIPMVIRADRHEVTLLKGNEREGVPVAGVRATETIDKIDDLPTAVVRSEASAKVLDTPSTEVRNHPGTEVHRQTGTQVPHHLGTEVHQQTDTEVRTDPGTEVRPTTDTNVISKDDPVDTPTVNEPVSSDKEDPADEEERELTLAERWTASEKEIMEQLQRKSTEVPEEETNRLQNILVKYPQMFQKPSREGCKLKVAHRVETGEPPPVNVQPYPIPRALGDGVAELLTSMLANGIIRPLSSPWNAPGCESRKEPRLGNDDGG
ncbi:hypothetical protein GE061_015915 [Apolygus lucorum]|uniref:CCHC-type domain-containing protein n=1 Tax=Apolygus lucorum TaxID=248454 RepID=A0A8S9XFY3_APOLU|nr:hypothetical protein GE061_015915 [Apolygus lucorum]